MRRAINENPLVQIAVVGVLAVVVGLLLLMRMGGGGDTAAPVTTTPATSAPASSDAATGTATAPASDATTPSADNAAGPEVTTPPSSTQFVAGPGLPKPAVSAYENGDAVVLLVTRHDGIEDRFLRAAVLELRNRGDVTVFTTSARHIADYSRIAGGVSVDRAPALVVVEPRNQADGALPSATVAYGFREKQSVIQAVEDVLYKGRSDLPYHP